MIPFAKEAKSMAKFEFRGENRNLLQDSAFRGVV